MAAPFHLIVTWMISHMQPTFRIAITGHRPHRMHVGVARIERQLFEVLRSLAKTARGQAVPRVPVAISALAEGSLQFLTGPGASTIKVQGTCAF